MITGASGFVGTNLSRYFVRREPVTLATHETALPEDLEDAAPSFAMDVRDAEAVRRTLREVAPSAVIHAAGNKNVRFCETHPEQAYAVNAIGAGNVARACREIGARMVYISTDLVFSCTGGGYQETDVPLPALVYGKSKLAGEQAVREHLPDAIICRSGGIYGRSSPLLRWLTCEIQAGRDVECFVDIFNTPTYAENLSEMLDFIVQHDLRGVFHTVGAQRVSRYQLFKIYANEFGLDTTHLLPVAASARRHELLLQPDASLSSRQTRASVAVPFNTVEEGMGRLHRAGGI